MNLPNNERTRFRFSPFFFYFFAFCLLLMLSGCATTGETTQLRSSTNALTNDLSQLQDEINSKTRSINSRLSGIEKEQETLRKQLINLATTTDGNSDNIRTVKGKLDELDHQLETYWKDTKAEISALKAESLKAQMAVAVQPATIAKPEDVKYESVYKEAFDAFQKGTYDEAINKFSDFIAAYPGTPLVSNAYYWLGESYLNIKNYEKAIINFQEVIDKYPKSDKASRALLSQADAFASVKDEKSSTTILKKVIELYPKTEEAAIAERKLRGLGLR